MIREYREEDFKEVFEIIKENFNIEKANCHDNNTIEYVVEENNKVIGYFIIRRVLDIVKNINYFYLEYVCISKDYQNKGFGSKIIEFVLQKAKEENITYIELTSSYERKAAHHLYEKYDFIKRQSDIYRRYL